MEQHNGKSQNKLTFMLMCLAGKLVRGILRVSATQAKPLAAKGSFEGNCEILRTIFNLVVNNKDGKF